MSVAEYKDSGILDVYVLGGLPADEAREVEAMAFRYPEIADEIALLQGTLENYARSMSREANASIKGCVLEKISFEEGGSGVAVRGFFQGNGGWIVAASWMLIFALGAMMLFYRQQWQETRIRLSSLERLNSSMADNFSRTRYAKEDFAYKLSLLSDTSVRKVTLYKLADKKEGFAQVYWDQYKGETYINVRYLPKAPSGKQYQLWAIVDGKPVDMGMIPEILEVEVIRMKEVSNASAFAVTLEEKGGNSLPTMEAMCVIGNI